MTASVDRPLRVVLLVTDHERGGTPMRCARLALGLRDLGVDVTVGCLGPSGPVSEVLHDAGIATFACDGRGGRDWRVLRRLDIFLRGLQPDLVHAFLFHANIAARWVGRRLGLPVIGSTATLEVDQRWHLWLQRWTRRWEAGHIVNSVALAEHVRRNLRAAPDSVHIVPPSIAAIVARRTRKVVRADLRLREADFGILWSGRLDPVKRLGLLIDAVADPRLAGARLLIVGDGPQRAALERQIVAMNLQQRVHLLGWRDDLADLYPAADVFAFPSRTEGTPNAVLEAMWSGTAVVASDIPAHRELAGPDQDRLWLVPESSPRAWSTALLQAREDDVGRQSRSAAAQQWARTLNPATTAKAVLDVYQHVLGQSPTSA